MCRLVCRRDGVGLWVGGWICVCVDMLMCGFAGRWVCRCVGGWMCVGICRCVMVWICG